MCAVGEFCSTRSSHQLALQIKEMFINANDYLRNLPNIQGCQEFPVYYITLYKIRLGIIVPDNLVTKR